MMMNCKLLNVYAWALFKSLSRFGSQETLQEMKLIFHNRLVCYWVNFTIQCHGSDISVYLQVPLLAVMKTLSNLLLTSNRCVRYISLIYIYSFTVVGEHQRQQKAKMKRQKVKSP